ncbi:hypothetical protein FOZ62_008574 [Perkinsus olseni]|uniref:Uncharacterized protein n=1 Tax=Perkinsus olseni TaxID=32597 RepID=A0A7J6SGJ2_PEROL|nr:hypothetical protein FOZ62_008574 [Perkinsus olseni]
MVGSYLRAPEEELEDMFRWLGSNACLRWVDLSEARNTTDGYLACFVEGLKAISPAPLNVLKLAGWSITEGMLCDVLSGCPNITTLDVRSSLVAADVTAFVHGLLSKRILRLPNGDVQFRCPVHGTFVAKNGDINDEFVSLLDAGGWVWQMRREPTYGLQITDGLGNLVGSFCGEGPTGRCTVEAFTGARASSV